jgi:hypothetical protein
VDDVSIIGGWVKLWRAILRHPLYCALTDRQRNVMVTTLLMANWQDRRWFCKELNAEVTIPRGAFVSSQTGIGREANTARQVVRGAIQRLAGGGFLQVRPLEDLLMEGVTQGGTGSPQNPRRTRRSVSLYVVVNYDHWQGDNQGTTNTATTEQPQSNPDLRRVKKGQEGKEDLRQVPASLPEDALLAADHLRASILEIKPTHKMASNGAWSGTREKWARVLDLTHRRDDRSWERIDAVISFLPTDPPQDNWPGWGSVVLSAQSLRDKFDKIEASMARSMGSGQGTTNYLELLPPEGDPNN